MHQTLELISTHKKLTACFVIIIDLFFFMLTNPSHTSVWLMIIGFPLILATIYIVCSLMKWTLRKLGLISEPRKWLVEAISGFIGMLLILQSVGQLSLRDIAALIPLSLIGYFYYTRVASKQIS